MDVCNCHQLVCVLVGSGKVEHEASSIIITQRFILFLFLSFYEVPVVGRDAEVRARQAGNEPPNFWRRRKLETRFARQFKSSVCFASPFFL